jgi:tRNA A22 N-methylase
MTRLEFLEQLKEEVCQNILCYSANYLMTKPKDNYREEWLEENEKLKNIEEMIKEENCKSKKKELFHNINIKF